jgi:hypothetical protein
MNKYWRDIKGYGRTSSKGKRHRVSKHSRRVPRRMSARHVKIMIAAADSHQEAGGMIDFRKGGRGIEELTVHTGTSGNIELHPHRRFEGIWHSHPTQNKEGTLDQRAEQYRQQSPSPPDIIQMLGYQHTVGDSFIATPDKPEIPDDGLFIHYSTSERTPKPTKKFEKQLWKDYNDVNAAAVKKHPNSQRKRMKYADREWRKLLRHKHDIYLRVISPAEYRDGVTLYLKEVK